MDCLEGMRALPDKCVDLVVTSPPYNIRNSSGGGMTLKGGTWNCPKGLKAGYGEYKDDLPHNEYVKWQRGCLDEVMRILKDDGGMFYNHKWRVQNGLLQDRSDILEGFPVRQIIIWQRGGGMNFNDGFFLPTYEVIYLISKDAFRLKKGANGVGDVWRINQKTGSVHPAPFPVELAHRCVSSTNAMIILDPFLGSGTTLRACRMTDRIGLGFELNPDYESIIRKRMMADTPKIESFFE